MMTTTQIGIAMMTARFLLSNEGGVVSNGVAETNAPRCQICCSEIERKEVWEGGCTLNCYDGTVMGSTVGLRDFVGCDE